MVDGEVITMSRRSILGTDEEGLDALRRHLAPPISIGDQAIIDALETLTDAVATLPEKIAIAVAEELRKNRP